MIPAMAATVKSEEMDFMARTYPDGAPSVNAGPHTCDSDSGARATWRPRNHRASRMKPTPIEVAAPRPDGSSSLFDLERSKAQRFERRERRPAMRGGGSNGFMTRPAVPANSDRVTPKANCFVTNPPPAGFQVETAASLPTRSRPQTSPKPWPGGFGIILRTAVMAISEN